MIVWKDRQGKSVTGKEFLVRFKDGIEKTTPLQQTRITLWSFPAIIGGLLWGMIITFISKTYWLSIILLASLPITSMQILNTYQKYQRLKMTEKLLKEATQDAIEERSLAT